VRLLTSLDPWLKKMELDSFIDHVGGRGMRLSSRWKEGGESAEAEVSSSNSCALHVQTLGAERRLP